MTLSEQTKVLLVYIFYGVIVALLAWVGYISFKYSVKIGSMLGSVLGGLVGLALVCFLWVKVGQKYVETTSV